MKGHDALKADVELGIQGFGDAAEHAEGMAFIVDRKFNLRSVRLVQRLAIEFRDGVLIVSPKGKLLYFNRAFVQTWQLPRDVLASRSDEAALAWAAEQTEDPERFLARVAEVYADQFRPAMREELRMKDGRVFEHFGAAVRKDGVHYGWIWTFSEITARK